MHSNGLVKLLSIGCAVEVAFAAAIEAQPHSIDWYKIAGGGGNSSNSQYTLSGTIGQHDASDVSEMTGGG